MFFASCTLSGQRYLRNYAGLACAHTASLLPDLDIKEHFWLALAGISLLRR